MTQAEIINAARDDLDVLWNRALQESVKAGEHFTRYHFAALVAAAERNKLAAWMISRGYTTGHGDTIEDLLQELEWQIAENWTRALVKGVEGEREACAKLAQETVCDTHIPTGIQIYGTKVAKAIRARSGK